MWRRAAGRKAIIGRRCRRGLNQADVENNGEREQGKNRRYIRGADLALDEGANQAAMTALRTVPMQPAMKGRTGRKQRGKQNETRQQASQRCFSEVAKAGDFPFHLHDVSAINHTTLPCASPNLARQSSRPDHFSFAFVRSAEAREVFPGCAGEASVAGFVSTSSISWFTESATASGWSNGGAGGFPFVSGARIASAAVVVREGSVFKLPGLESARAVSRFFAASPVNSSGARLNSSRICFNTRSAVAGGSTGPVKRIASVVASSSSRWPIA